MKWLIFSLFIIQVFSHPVQETIEDQYQPPTKKADEFCEMVKVLLTETPCNMPQLWNLCKFPNPCKSIKNEILNENTAALDRSDITSHKSSTTHPLDFLKLGGRNKLNNNFNFGGIPPGMTAQAFQFFIYIMQAFRRVIVALLTAPPQ